ncbi:MAG: hypothetical protein K1W22_05385 [Lachnospiraceae bacterium]
MRKRKEGSYWMCPQMGCFARTGSARAGLGKWPGRISGILLALCMSVLAVPPVHLEAAKGAYTYQVRIFAGAQGAIDGKDMVVYEGLDGTEDSRVTFNQSRVTLKDSSKYYIRGIRESGRDNEEVLSLASFVPTEDKDYVVAYGILGDAVMYTVEYVDEAGNSLAPAGTYYGNVGDRPVVAFTYIEGYQPQTYNLTGTLDSDASKNVFRFIYTAAARAEAPVPEGGTVPGTTAPAAPAGGATPEPGTAAPAAEPTAGTEPAAGGETAVAGDEQVPLAQPDDLQDISDPGVPLADGSGMMEDTVRPNGIARLIGNLPLAARAGIGLAVVAAAGMAWFFLIYKKKKETALAGRKVVMKNSKGRNGSEE